MIEFSKVSGKIYCGEVMDLIKFENITRQAHLYTVEQMNTDSQMHSFDIRNIHEKFPPRVKELFDDSYYSQATFEACKYLDKVIAGLSNSKDFGVKLMMHAFNESSPKIKISNMQTISAGDEQQGYKFLFSGSSYAIRNPRAHEYLLRDTIEDCLDHLSFLSMLLRKLEKEGYSF
jgi:uncharacterized protein (TIGR02391 family)